MMHGAERQRKIFSKSVFLNATPTLLPAFPRFGGLCGKILHLSEKVGLPFEADAGQIAMSIVPIATGRSPWPPDFSLANMVAQILCGSTLSPALNEYTLTCFDSTSSAAVSASAFSLRHDARLGSLAR